MFLRYFHTMVKPNEPPALHMRVSDQFIHDVDNWRRRQADIPSRAEAIRRLVARGLRAEELDRKRRD
jgi:hypothetical protein